MLNNKLYEICQPLISKLKFWIFPLFLLHTLRYLGKQKVIYALKIVRQCLAFVTLTSAALTVSFNTCTTLGDMSSKPLMQ